MKTQLLKSIFQSVKCLVLISTILLSSYSGKLIRFHESKVRPMGRTARGVKGITLQDGMKVISLMIGDPSKTILCLSENGFGKRIAKVFDYKY